ncbi:MAG: peroxiredoxin family protein [Patescibacteria group bacterium]
MTNKNVFIIVLVAVVGLIVVAFLFRGTGTKPSTIAVDNHNHSMGGDTGPTTVLSDMVGKPAPDFSLTDRAGTKYSSQSLLGKNVVLFFNEGLMCYPACWSQIASLAKDERFKSANAVVLSVVVDSADEWQSAVNKMPELAAATVVFDKDGIVSKKFGMLTTPSSMHYGSLPGHSYVLIDKQGVVRHMFDDPNMSLHNDQLIEQLAQIK